MRLKCTSCDNRFRYTGPIRFKPSACPDCTDSRDKCECGGDLRQSKSKNRKFCVSCNKERHGTKTYTPFMPCRNLAWTKEEDSFLRSMWGLLSTTVLSKRLGRSWYAVKARAIILGCKSSDCSLTTVGELSRETGYSYERIEAAAKKIGVELVPFPKMFKQERTVKKKKGFDSVGVDKILTFLKEWPDGKAITDNRQIGVWGARGRPTKCLMHGDVDRPHYAKGMCKICYMRKSRMKC